MRPHARFGRLSAVTKGKLRNFSRRNFFGIKGNNAPKHRRLGFRKRKRSPAEQGSARHNRKLARAVFAGPPYAALRRQFAKPPHRERTVKRAWISRVEKHRLPRAKVLPDCDYGYFRVGASYSRNKLPRLHTQIPPNRKDCAVPFQKARAYLPRLANVQVSGANKEIIDAALGKVKAIVAVPEVGEVYDGVVRSIMPYGAFVEFMSGRDGLLHISEIDWKRLETVEEAGLKEGDHIQVKLVDIDQKTGKFKLSRRVLLEKPEGYVERPRRERPERGERRERRPRQENPTPTEE